MTITNFPKYVVPKSELARCLGVCQNRCSPKRRLFRLAFLTLPSPLRRLVCLSQEHDGRSPSRRGTFGFSADRINSFAWRLAARPCVFPLGVLSQSECHI